MVNLNDFIKQAQKLADRNGDGKIDEKDWQEATKNLDKDTLAKVEEAKKHLDLDKNGKYDLADLQKGLSSLDDISAKLGDLGKLFKK